MTMRDRVRNALRMWLFGDLLLSVCALDRNMRGDAHIAHRDSLNLADLMRSQDQKLDRLLLLLEPQAARLHARRPVVQDWDEVQRKNLLQELEGETHGQSIRQ